MRDKTSMMDNAQRMDLEVGEQIISVDLIEDLTPQQYIQQLLIQQKGGCRNNEASFNNLTFNSITMDTECLIVYRDRRGGGEWILSGAF
ncbi:MAG: hypothetical protein MJE68_14435 [Proteobacteria bacterium]|nr:hypothetical protein [Pseudomonadota bacterium]